MSDSTKDVLKALLTKEQLIFLDMARCYSSISGDQFVGMVDILARRVGELEADLALLKSTDPEWLKKVDAHRAGMLEGAGEIANLLCRMCRAGEAIKKDGADWFHPASDELCYAQDAHDVRAKAGGGE